LVSAASYAFIQTGLQSGGTSPLPPAAGKDSAENRRQSGADSETSPALRHSGKKNSVRETSSSTARLRALDAYAAQSEAAAARQGAGLDLSA